MKKLVLATRNRDKIREISAILAGIDVELLSFEQFPEIPEVIEDGMTLEENAAKKARAVSDFTNLPSLADDTGLEVIWLNGAPGVRSSRYAGESASYEDNVKKLLHELRGVPEKDRKARFRTVVAFYDGERMLTVQGWCDGYISKKARGTQGFGYDPVFFVREYNMTFAEMDLHLKNQISHRGRAFRQVRQLFEEMN